MRGCERNQNNPRALSFAWSGCWRLRELMTTSAPPAAAILGITLPITCYGPVWAECAAGGWWADQLMATRDATSACGRGALRAVTVARITCWGALFGTISTLEGATEHWMSRATPQAFEARVGP